MGKKKRYNKRTGQAAAVRGRGHSFSIVTTDVPMPVLTQGTQYHEIWYDDAVNHWRQPIDRLALAQLANMCAAHGSILYARRNMITADYMGGGLSLIEMGQAAYDWVTFGDVALLKVRNGWGDVVDLVPLPMLYLRRRKDGNFAVLQKGPSLVYPARDVIFLKNYDPQQQVYGLPDYIGGIHSALLNMEATVFRRRYFHNGAHTGGIVYTTDPNLTDEMEEDIAKKIEETKGVGNFKMMYINIADGNEKGVQFIPIGDAGVKDEFANVKNISAQDVLTAHRFPPGLGGVIPENSAGFPNPETARETYRKDEVVPIQRMFASAVNQDPELPERLHLRFAGLDAATLPRTEKPRNEVVIEPGESGAL
ncbi:phage portal protein [Lelliottia nimipressuralis]|uniref:phage portal protein n=1 Tax=Lelliottia nimipressuralis TaxID=69220 RepID=UPI0028A149EB|nr:phage portal protein [Lelliottia nimipressuralis]